MVSPEHVARFLDPESVCIVGASARESGSYQAGGRAVLHHLLTYGYRGRISVIHPSAADIEGVPAYRTMADLPGTPDCVVVAVPAPGVLTVLEQCAAVGVHRVLIITGGFGELGAEGAQLEATLVEYARSHGIRLVGPNSTGLVNVVDGVAMSMTSVLTEGSQLKSGGLAVLAQSGAISSSIVERAREADVGIAHLASIGNQGDLGAGDFLAYFAEDPRVRAVCMYLETIHDRDAVTEGIRRLHAAGKQVVALLGGRSAAGERAAASHTGKMLGRAQLELSLLESLGVYLVEDLDDLWRLGSYLVERPDVPPIGRWAVFTMSGGMGVLTMDRMAEAGVETAEFSSATRARLLESLPAYVAPVNPLDIGPGPMPAMFEPLLQTVMEDDGVDAACVPIPMGAAGWHGAIVDGIRNVAARTSKPVIVSWYGGEVAREHLRELRAASVLAVETPTELGRLVRALTTAAPDDGGMAANEAHPVAPPQNAAVGGASAVQLLAEAGVDVVQTRVCSGEDETVDAASAIGYPVVVKSADEQIAHRLELGLVKVGLQTPHAVRTAVRSMTGALADLPGGSVAPTFMVQEMVTKGRELVLAVRSAGALGNFGGVGLGGSAVELLGDLVYLPLPCDQSVLLRELRRLRGSQILFGYRGEPAVDLDWVWQTLHAMEECLRAHDFSEIEVNPAIVGSAGGLVVDALCIA